MKGYNIAYFFREGVKSIFQHGFMSFAAVTTIVACLVIMGSFGLLSLNVNEAIRQAEEENEILAFVDDSLGDSEALALGTKIYAIENVKTAEFVTRDEAFKQYSEYLGEDATLLEGLENEDVLRHRWRIFIHDIEEMGDTVEQLKAIRGVDKVNAGFEISDSIISMRNVVNIITYILAVILACVSIFIISNTVKLTTFDRREEIAIMRMVGATNSFIRWPFVVQGFILGVFGGVVAFFCQWGIYNFVGNKLPEYSSIITLVSFSDLSIFLLLAFIVIGFVVGVGGSVTTIRKFMRV